MTVKEIIIMLSRRSDVTQEQLAIRLGYPHKSGVAVPLNRKDGMGMKTETFMKWVEELGCQIVVQSPDGDDDLILDGEEEGVRYGGDE